MLNYSVVDAFTSVVFKGNPAAVIVTDVALPAPTMQSIASEFNLSETAFLVNLGGEVDEDSINYSIRWFTPSVEAPLCGHASLASSFVLFAKHPSKSNITFTSRFSGTLKAKRLADNRIELDFPAFPTTEVLKTSEEFKRIQSSINENVVDPNASESGADAAKLSGGRRGAEIVKLARGRHGYVLEIAKAISLSELKVDALKLAQDAFVSPTSLPANGELDPTNLRVARWKGGGRSCHYYPAVVDAGRRHQFESIRAGNRRSRGPSSEL